MLNVRSDFPKTFEADDPVQSVRHFAAMVLLVLIILGFVSMIPGCATCGGGTCQGAEPEALPGSLRIERTPFRSIDPVKRTSWTKPRLMIAAFAEGDPATSAGQPPEVNQASGDQPAPAPKPAPDLPPVIEAADEPPPGKSFTVSGNHNQVFFQSPGQPSGGTPPLPSPNLISTHAPGLGVTLAQAPGLVGGMTTYSTLGAPGYLYSPHTILQAATAPVVATSLTAPRVLFPVARTLLRRTAVNLANATGDLTVGHHFGQAVAVTPIATTGVQLMTAAAAVPTHTIYQTTYTPMTSYVPQTTLTPVTMMVPQTTAMQVAVPQQQVYAAPAPQLQAAPAPAVQLPAPQYATPQAPAKGR